MSNANTLDDLLRSDDAIQAELAAAMEAYDGDRTDDKAIFEAVLAPLAEAHGLPVTYEELEEYASTGIGLSNEELEQIAGGESYCFVVGGGNEVDAYACKGGEHTGAVACGYVGVGFFDNFLGEFV